MKIVESTIERLKSFNPCFFGLFCNFTRGFRRCRAWRKFQSLFFWTFLQRYEPWGRWEGFVLFQSLFFWTFLQPASILLPPNRTTGFNPCFFGLFCNFQHSHNVVHHIIQFQSLFFWTFLQLCMGGNLQILSYLVSILVFLDFSATFLCYSPSPAISRFQSLFFWTFLQPGIQEIIGAYAL